MLDSPAGMKKDDFNFEEFKLSDTQAKKDWEELMGFKIKSNTVKVSRRFYEEHAGEISGIQMMAAIRYQKDNKKVVTF